MDGRIPGLIILAVFLLSWARIAGAQTMEGMELIGAESSPLATFEILTYREIRDDHPQTEIWVASDRRGSNRERIFQGEGETWIQVSSDERYLAVNSRKSAGYGFLEIYRRTGKYSFESLKSEVERRALAELMKLQKRTETPRFSSFFCQGDFWSSDSGCLLAHLEGREIGSRKTSRFYFIYDPASNSVSLDLALFNRGSFGIPAP